MTTAPPLDETTAGRLAAMRQALEGVDRLGVAFSGGVDSAVLLAAATRWLGRDRVRAVLAVSPSLAADERAIAHEVADRIGVELIEISTREGDREGYVRNGPDRCYFCKHELFTVIDDTVAVAHGLTAIAYGENADDALRRDRPGSRAATEHGVLRPLADAGLTKAEVRAVARVWGLQVAEKPAAPCLASRIPHFTTVTPWRLHQIEEAERVLRHAGFRDCRVRHHGATARIEVPADELSKFDDDGLKDVVTQGVRAVGFDDVQIDPEGLKSGAFTLAVLDGEAQQGRRHG